MLLLLLISLNLISNFSPNFYDFPPNQIDNCKPFNIYNDTLNIYINVYFNSEGDGIKDIVIDDSCFIFYKDKLVYSFIPLWTNPSNRFIERDNSGIFSNYVISNTLQGKKPLTLYNLYTGKNTIYNTHFQSDDYTIEIINDDTILVQSNSPCVYCKITKDTILNINSDIINNIRNSLEGVNNISLSKVLYLENNLLIYRLFSSKNYNKKYYLIYNNKLTDSISNLSGRYIKRFNSFVHLIRYDTINNVPLIQLYKIDDGKFIKESNDSVFYNYFIDNKLNRYKIYDYNFVYYIGDTYIIDINDEIKTTTLFYDSKFNKFFEPKIKYFEIIKSDGKFKEIKYTPKN